MLGVCFGRDDPRDLRQIAGEHVLAEDIEEGAASRDLGSGLSAFVQRAAGRRILILVEVEQRVIAVVSDIGVLGPAPLFRSRSVRAPTS